jgi:hypothetical protein
MIEIETRVAGIPALVRVSRHSYQPPDPSTWASSEDFSGGWDLDYEVCDRRGRPAPWLADKLDQRAVQNLEQTIMEYLS